MEKKILIANDDEPTRNLLETMIHLEKFRRGYQIIKTGEIFKSLKKIAKENFDWIIAGGQIPYINNSQFIKYIMELKNEHELYPILFTSSNEENKKKIEIYSGKKGFLLKVFSYEDFNEEFARLFEH